MGRILSTYLGRTSVPRELTEFEMREYFTLSAADKRALPTAVRTRLRLAVALQLGFLRMTGTTLDAFDYVPRDLLEFVARQVGRPAPMLATLRGLYRRRMSLFRHQSCALEHLGVHRYGPEDEASAIDALVSETRATVDRDRLAGRVRGFLYVQRCCIPGPRVIEDLVRRVLREVESRDAEALRVHIGAAACAMWYERLMELRSDGISWLEWVRRPPGRRSPKSLRNAIGKLLYRCEFPRLTEGRSGIPPERLRAYGRRIRRLLKDIVALRLGGAPLDPVLKALRELESSYKDGWLTLFPEAAVPFARPWQALVDDPDRERAFRAYEAATLWCVRRGLRSGALYLYLRSGVPGQGTIAATGGGLECAARLVLFATRPARDR